MSKRRRSPPREVVNGGGCLDFVAWRAQQAATEGITRADDSVYDPATETLPAHPWYALDHTSLRKTILRMCAKLGKPLQGHQINDPEITDLLKNLTQAHKIPPSSRVTVAVVGNQGVGKSSTINALLNRDLVDASASASACTAFATIIEYKTGAKDDTDLSDLKVTFLETSEIQDFIEEHIRRYADVYMPEGVDNDDVAVEAEDAENDAASDFSEKDMSEEDVSDSDLSFTSEQPSLKKVKRKRVSKAEQKGADTAEQFFRVLFNAQLDDSKEAELQDWLEKPGLEDGRFLEHCLKVASEHLANVRSEEDGSVEYKDVKDSDLQKMRNHATMMWPLVKSVTISTGSILLRNGIQFMDLPGYGDLNQTREAVVNHYRRKANFEMVVAKSNRYLSKTDEDRFLHRAIRHHDAKNVFLVLNKTDTCLETPQNQVVRMLKDETEEPFATIQNHLSGIGDLEGVPRKTTQQYRKYLIIKAQMAAGKRECDKIRSKMQRKGVRVFAVSSARYFDWLDPSQLEVPPFDPEGTGIPGLRRALLMLPAEASYKDIKYHIFETVTDIEDKVSRILMKFNHDIDVAGIRRYVVDNLPNLRNQLRELSDNTSDSLLFEVWSESAKRKVAAGMEAQIMTYNHKDEVMYNAFSHMLRNNGIAVTGKNVNKNLNDELMQTYKKTIKAWKYKASDQEGPVKQSLWEPVQAAIAELKQLTRAAGSVPELKWRVHGALSKLSRRINTAHGDLSNNLEEATTENYRHFTTEDDIKCPVAIELKSAYTRINMIRMDERPKHRKGIYKDQRREMIRTVTEDNNGMKPLVDAISVLVKEHQRSLWQEVGTEFIADVSKHFEEFAQALSELLENETYMLEEHKLIRGQLRQELAGFSKDLASVKGHFEEPEVGSATKKVRTMNIEEHADGETDVMVKVEIEEEILEV